MGCRRCGWKSPVDGHLEIVCHECTLRRRAELVLNEHGLNFYSAQQLDVGELLRIKGIGRKLVRRIKGDEAVKIWWDQVTKG